MVPTAKFSAKTFGERSWITLFLIYGMIFLAAEDARPQAIDISYSDLFFN